MGKLSAKNKIALYALLWLLMCLAAFLFVFKILDNSNSALVASFANQEHQVALLQAEEDSYRQATADLVKVKNLKYQPQDLFSQDITFVNELKTLENLAQQTNVTATINGISGTVQTAQKAGTLSALTQIPYQVSISGLLPNCLSYMEGLENLKFVTTFSAVTVGASQGGNVSVNLTGYFYLRPQ